ncbi:MAG: alpha/beta hydrolase [Cyanobacteria bacterium TGS_CYA1]|nr:alpha/beta hydrolase [Cyanobacteria bacterium TGS_CYA1]
MVPCLEGIQGKNVDFESKNGSRLNGWYYKKSESRFTILFNHGNAGTIENRAGICSLLLKAGYSVFLYDYQGYGYSEGIATISGIVEDSVAAFDYLTNNLEVKSDEIMIYGESLGVAVSCHLSDQRKCAALILQSGFSSLKAIAGYRYPILRLYPKWLYPLPGLDSLSVLKRSKVPVLIVHGKLDAVIPYSHSEEMFNAVNHDKKQFVSYADVAHSDICTVKPQEYVEALKGLISLV